VFADTVPVMRSFSFGFFGLAGIGFLGLMLSSRHGGGAAIGFIGGIAVFACLRLWLATRRPPA
jgi:hypothetical protein